MTAQTTYTAPLPPRSPRQLHDGLIRALSRVGVPLFMRVSPDAAEVFDHRRYFSEVVATVINWSRDYLDEVGPCVHDLAPEDFYERMHDLMRETAHQFTTSARELQRSPEE